MATRITQSMKFEQESKGLKRSVANLFKAVCREQEAVQASISELGKRLVELRDLAKQYHQGFRSSVEHESVGIPVRSAYRYIALFKQAKKIKPRIAALVVQAGYDPAEKRIQATLKRQGSKVNKMTAAELAKKLAKGGGRRSVHALCSSGL